MAIRQRFRESLRCGTGEAYLILRANKNIDFSKDIEKAALKNYAYDPQCEGDRAFYISQLIELSGKKELFVEAVIKALGKEREDCWNLAQLFALATNYAKQGNERAKHAIYNRFGKKAIKGAEWLGEEEILEIDGLEGIKHIAKVRGKALTKDPDDWEDSFLVDNFQKENPKIKVYNELKKEAETNSFIKKYLDTIKENKWSEPKPPKKPKFNYEFIRNRIDNGSRFPASKSVAEKLVKADVIKLANDFRQEKDPDRKEKFLSIFTKIKYPYDYKEILEIAKGKTSRNNRLVEFACNSLSFFEAKDIRQFALSKLSKTNIPYYYLPLLVANYKRGDHKLLAEIANRYKNEDIIHYLVWSYIQIYIANKTKECKKPLEIIYSKLTCGIHRYDIVKILHDNGVLSKKIQKELEFDSYKAIRDCC